MISVIIPFYNERGTLSPLVSQLKSVFKKIRQTYEVILIDDGSTDGSADIAGKEMRKASSVHLIKQRKRFGKGRALETGFNASKGNTIIFMDADLQNDPADLPKFLEAIKNGNDFVNGYRKTRNDGIDKTLPSKFYNKLIKWLFSLELHDINCGFKAMKREVLENVPLYGDNYRILPILAKNEGFKLAEIEVIHHPRTYGVSKYGALRLLFGFFDVISHYFLLKYFEKPIHFFGTIGTIFLSIGTIILFYLGFERIAYQQMLYRRPILFLGLLLVIVGVQVIVTGFIGELIVYLNKRKRL